MRIADARPRWNPKTRPEWVGDTPTPDRGFVQKLKEFDKNLWVEFDRKLSCFVIYQPSVRYGKAVAHVVRPESDEVPYRQPDERDIANLYVTDFARKSAKRRITEGEEKIVNAHQKSDKDAADDLRDKTKDDRIQLRNTYIKATNQGKAAHVFRHPENPGQPLCPTCGSEAFRVRSKQSEYLKCSYKECPEYLKNQEERNAESS